MNIALYARVSTTRQADNDLSIPDQLRQMRQWAERNGHIVVKEYIEPGNTATDDKRPVFQDMIADATMKGHAPYQGIIVHSFSRFFRDHVEGAMYQRRLRKHGVKVESITQHTNDDPSGEMHRSMIMLFDEYQSKENAKHTLRGMQENARQGYFNGSKAPFGYKTVEAGQTGIHGRVKKKLAIHEPEAEIVREIFSLYVYGKNGPRIGMKEIAKSLNNRGMLMRSKPWRIQSVHLILSSPTYSGWHVFNRLDSKTMKKKDEAEWIKTPVPAIVDQELFDKASKLRAAYTPLRCAPRRETSPNLLTGVLKCDCGSSMVLQTAKNNQYRYYKCSARISKGDTVCKANSYPVDKLEKLVLDVFKNQIYTPGYIKAVIDDLRRQTSKSGSEDQLRVKKLESELKEIEQAETKLYEAIEKGILELDDRLKARVHQHKTRREIITAELANLQRKHHTPLQTLTPQKIEAAARVLNRRFSVSTPFSRAYLKATLREIRIQGDFLKLSGDRKAMASLVAANGQLDGDNTVLRFIPEWRPLRPSNLCFMV
jgi:site-specific DNA recombinase